MGRFAVPFVMMLLLTPVAWADEPKHGGQVKKLGPYEAELVVRGGDVLLYVIKDHKPMSPTPGMAASVRLFANNAEQVVALAPASDKLAGKVAASVSGNVRVMATLTDGGKELGKAQFNLSVR